MARQKFETWARAESVVTTLRTLKKTFGQVGLEVRKSGFMEVMKEKSACVRMCAAVLADFSSLKWGVGAVVLVSRVPR